MRSAPITSRSEITFFSRGGLVYGRGAGMDDASHLSQYGTVTPVVNNRFGAGSESRVPHYYTSDGYAALGVSSERYTQADGSFLAATYEATPSFITWRNSRKGPLDIYLMP